MELGISREICGLPVLKGGLGKEGEGLLHRQVVRGKAGMVVNEKREDLDWKSGGNSSL